MQPTPANIRAINNSQRVASPPFNDTSLKTLDVTKGSYVDAVKHDYRQCNLTENSNGSEEDFTHNTNTGYHHGCKSVKTGDLNGVIKQNVIGHDLGLLPEMSAETVGRLKNFIDTNLNDTLDIQANNYNTGLPPSQPINHHTNSNVSDDQKRSTRRRRPSLPDAVAESTVELQSTSEADVRRITKRNQIVSCSGEGDGLRDDAEGQDIPQPLTKTNVTKHDTIWSSDIKETSGTTSVNVNRLPIPLDSSILKEPHGDQPADFMHSDGTLSDDASEYSYSSQDTTVFNSNYQSNVAPNDSTMHNSESRNRINNIHVNKDAINSSTGHRTQSIVTEDFSNREKKTREEEISSNSNGGEQAQGVKVKLFYFKNNKKNSNKPFSEDDDGYESTDNMSTGSNNSSSSSASSVPVSSLAKPELDAKAAAKRNIVSVIQSKQSVNTESKAKVVPVNLPKTITPSVNLASHKQLDSNDTGREKGRMLVLDRIKQFSPKTETPSVVQPSNGECCDSTTDILDNTEPDVNKSSGTKTVLREHFIKPGDTILTLTRTITVKGDNDNNSENIESSCNIPKVKNGILHKPKSILKSKSKKKVSFNLPEPHGDASGDELETSNSYQHTFYEEAEQDKYYMHSSPTMQHTEFVPNGSSGDRFAEHLARKPLSFTDKVNYLHQDSAQIFEDFERACTAQGRVASQRYDNNHSEEFMDHRTGVGRTLTPQTVYNNDYNSEYVNQTGNNSVANEQSNNSAENYGQHRHNIEIVHQHLQRNSRYDLPDFHHNIDYAHQDNSFAIHSNTTNLLDSSRDVNTIHNTQLENKPPSLQPSPFLRERQLPPAVPLKTHTQDDIYIGSPFARRRNDVGGGSFRLRHPGSFADNQPNIRHSFAGSHRAVSMPPLIRGSYNHDSSPHKTYTDISHAKTVQPEDMTYPGLISSSTTHDMTKSASNPDIAHGTEEYFKNAVNQKAYTSPRQIGNHISIPHTSNQVRPQRLQFTTPSHLNKNPDTRAAIPQPSSYTQSLPRRLNREKQSYSNNATISHNGSSQPSTPSNQHGNNTQHPGTPQNPTKKGAIFAKTSDIYQLMQHHGPTTQKVAEQCARPYRHYRPNDTGV